MCFISDIIGFYYYILFKQFKLSDWHMKNQVNKLISNLYKVFNEIYNFLHKYYSRILAEHFSIGAVFGRFN